MLQIIAIVFLAVLIFVLSDIDTRQTMRRFLERGCAGFQWRRRFPQASKSEIREFLDVFIEAFGFKQRWRLYFAPDDRVLDVYHTLYGGKPMTDSMELETLVEDLQKRYRVDILGSWREDITLGDLFMQDFVPRELPPNTALEPTADKACGFSGSVGFVTRQFGGGSAFGR